MTLDIYPFPLQIGGNLCLDFTNTTEFRDSDRKLEFLRSYEHVLAWCWQHQLVGDEESERLRTEAVKHQQDAHAAFQKALDLREMFYRVFTARIANTPPEFGNLALLNQILADTHSRRSIGLSNHGEFAWVWNKSDDLASILAPITLAAAELLTSDQLQWVRQCPNCGWLFLDTSRNHTRRWCSMDFCGSQVKSRRQYERRKTAKV